MRTLFRCFSSLLARSWLVSITAAALSVCGHFLGYGCSMHTLTLEIGLTLGSLGVRFLDFVVAKC